MLNVPRRVRYYRRRVTLGHAVTRMGRLNPNERLNLSDVRALLRLCNLLHETDPEPALRKRRLLQGLCALTGADDASAQVAAFTRAGPAATPAVISVVHSGGESGPRHGGGSGRQADRAGVGPPPWALFRRHMASGAVDDPGGVGWCAPESVSAAARPLHRAGRPTGHSVYSFLRLSDAGVLGCLTLRRAPGRPRFSNRDRAIACVLHAAAAWVYRADVMLASPDARALSPRQRETLRHLLAGHSEKQIAADMGLSPNTIHTYAKALHRHFGVSTRGELLARWVGR